MLFPAEAEYRDWFAAAGFEDIRVLRLAAPWNGDSDRRSYAVAVSGRATQAGPPVRPPVPSERIDEPWTARRLLRFAAGALAGALFVPVGLVLNLRARRAAER
jgi:hypothetical protein